MPSSRYSRQSDDYYYDARTDGRRSSGQVQDVSYSELQGVRRREMSVMDRRSRYDEDRDYDYRRSRRRRSTSDYDGSERASRRGGGSSQRDSQANNQQVAPYQQQRQARQRQRDQEGSRDNEEDREEGGFFERRFDKGSDGIITAVAGAAMGAITARHFAGPKDFSAEAETKRGKVAKNWRMIGGAVLGAAAFNMAQKQFHDHFEEESEAHENMETGIETVGEVIGAAAPDVL